MATKTCLKCGAEKEFSEFYRRHGARDGHRNECKTCAKEAVRANVLKNIDRYREYHRERGSRQTPEHTRNYRVKNTVKRKAMNMVNNAVRAGQIVREPCEVCGSTGRIHAHHDDYAKPLNVRWLCAAHHKQWHIENGEGVNPR